MNTSVKGNRIFDSDEVKAVFGDDAVRKVADAVKNTSDKEMSLKAETMKDRLDSGKDLTGTQKYDLYQGYLDKVNETAKKAKASYGVVENAREEQDLVPTMGRDRTGNTVYAKATQREFNEKFASTELTVEALKNYMESDNSISDDESRRANAVKKAVADIHVGGLTVGDAHEFAYGNTLAREALKAEEDIDLDQYIVRNADGTVDLSATNEATENALFQMNADNAIKAAQVETEVFKDDYRGDIDRDVMSRFGNNGQAIWKEVNKDLDPRDLQNYLTTANAASYFYSAGRNTDMGVDEAVNRYADTFKTVDNSVLKRAYAAGARDRIIANTPGYGQTVESGSNIQLKKTKPIITGQLIMDKDVVIPDSDQSAYLALAMSTNTNIHIVSSLKSKQGVEINGMSHGNDIYLNVNAAAESNLGYVFMHEMTHQIKQYAPNEYLALENLVRDRWFNKDQKGMQKAIKDRIDLYSTKGGQQLTEEEAVEEIIADAMAEAMDDPDFAAQVCEEDINLGQAILNSIREALRSIRNMFANNEFRNERFHNSLLSYLDILDEAEKMWLDALATARQNKANGLIADWQDRANKQNTERLSMLTTSEMPSMEDVDQTNTLITSDNGDAVAQFQEDGAVSFSISSYENEGRKIYKDYLDKLVNDKELSQKEATDMLRELETIYDISKRFADSGRFEPYTAWSYADVVTDAKGKPVFSSIRKNSEYKMNIDFSTICKKRRTLDAVFREMIRRGMFEKLDLNKDESAAMVVNINNLIRKNKFEAACALCFVEARRYRQQQTAKTFTNMWNELVESMYSDKDKIAYFNFGRDEQVQDVPDGIHTMDDSQLDLSHVRAVAEELNDKGKPKQTAEAKAARLILNNPEQRKLMRVGDMMASTGFENMHVENPELEIENSDKPVFVDVFATWCGPCKMMSPIIDEIAEQNLEGVKVGKVNCDEKCLICNDESKKDDLCLACNVEKGYYPVIYPGTEQTFYECYKSTIRYDRLFFNEKEKAFKPCYETCKECDEEGDPENHNCISCDTNLVQKPGSTEETFNCVTNCDYSYYFTPTGQYKCTGSVVCPSSASMYIKEKKKCIDKCQNDADFKYVYNGECLSDCPDNTTKDIENYLCKEKATENDCTLNVREILVDNMYDYDIINSLVKSYRNEYSYTNKHTIKYRNSGYNLFIYKDLDCIDLLDLGLVSIDIDSCINKVKEE